jgi:hypothetical protein
MDPTVENNTITGCSAGIAFAGGQGAPCHPVVRGNNIFENRDLLGVTRNIWFFPPYDYEGSEYTVDMESNWWGTTDEDSIQAWIIDRNDNSEVFETVDYDPWLTEPVGLPW